MKNSLKYLLLVIFVCLCSFAIYHLVGPTEEHNIGILFYDK